MTAAHPAADGPLAEYLRRPLQRPDTAVLESIERGPIDPALALDRDELDRLLDLRPMPRETGWCTLPDGVGYVAVRTAMPGVSGAMVDWWFDWHAREALRYRVWHPQAHRDNSVELPRTRRAKAHWGAVHHPVEDVGTGTVHARIAFQSPTEMGMSTDALEHPDVATIVCGYAGDDRRHVRHTPMFHVFLREHDGVVLRSRFWIGAALRPYGSLGAPAAPLLNNRLVRRLALPDGLPRALANHCAEEYANLAVLLPELYARFGPGSAEVG
jgi:phloretin hydrolase